MHFSVLNFLRYFNSNLRCGWIRSPQIRFEISKVSHPYELLILPVPSCSVPWQQMLWATFSHYSPWTTFLQKVLLTSMHKWILFSLSGDLIAVLIIGFSLASIPYHYPSTHDLFLRALTIVGNSSQYLHLEEVLVSTCAVLQNRYYQRGRKEMWWKTSSFSNGCFLLGKKTLHGLFPAVQPILQIKNQLDIRLIVLS